MFSPDDPFEKERRVPLDSAFDSIRDDLARVDREFQKNLGSRVPIISEIASIFAAAAATVQAKLLLLSSKLCGYQGDFHISMAGLIEFIHTATLLHDDVVDKAQVRRGSASANSIWATKRVCLLGTFSSRNVFPSWWKAETGRSSRPSRMPPCSWRRGSCRNC